MSSEFPITDALERSTEIAQLMEALAKAQGLIKNPTFDSQNPHFKMRYASLAAVRDAVTPALTQHGIALTQLVSTAAQEVICTTVLWHSSGQYLSSTLRLPVTKPDAQGYGAALTYARRYSLMAVCNVAGDQDEDGQTPPVTTADQKAKQEWIEKLQVLMMTEGATQEEIERFWRYVAHKYGDALSPSLGERLYGELQVRFAAKKKQTPPPEDDEPPVDETTGAGHDDERPAAKLPAGQAGATYVAQIEAALHAYGGGIAQFWTWAEAQIGKRQEQFSVNDYVGLLKRVRERATQKKESRHEEPDVQPELISAGAHEEEA